VVSYIEWSRCSLVLALIICVLMVCDLKMSVTDSGSAAVISWGGFVNFITDPN
jgi:hypothetical protein